MATTKDPASASSYVGVAIACAGNVLISLALTLQKLAHLRYQSSSGSSTPRGHQNGGNKTPPLLGTTSPLAHRASLSSGYGYDLEVDLSELSEADTSRDDHEGGTGEWVLPGSSGDESGYLRSKLWWAGLALMGLGEFGNFLSYGFAPASVVAPLGTVALVANCFFAPVILGESFTKRNVLGMTLAVLGAVTIVWSAKDANPRLSPDELLAAVLAPSFLIYTGLTIALLVPLTLLSATDWGARYIAIDVGTCALYGGYTVMATKALSSLLSSAPLDAFAHAITWVAVVVLVVTSVLQIKYLNRALMRFESKEVIPTQFVFFSLSAIVGSAVLYQEFRGLSLSNFVNFAFGIATTFLGVYFLTNPAEPSTPTLGLPPTPSPTLAPLGTVDEETPLFFDQERRGSTLRPPRPIATQPRTTLSHKHSAGSLGRLPQSQGGLLLISSTPSTPVAFAGRGRSDSTASTPVLSPVSSRRL